MQSVKNNQFTDRYIRALEPKEGQKRFYDVRESSGEGFGVSVFPSGEKSFFFIYHFASRKRRMTLGKYPHCSLADARRLHRDAMKVLADGKDPALERHKERKGERDSLTVDRLIQEYLEIWAKPRKRSWAADQRMLHKDIRPLWGKLKAKDVTRRDVIQLLDKIKERGAPHHCQPYIGLYSQNVQFCH